MRNAGAGGTQTDFGHRILNFRRFALSIASGLALNRTLYSSTIVVPLLQPARNSARSARPWLAWRQDVLDDDLTVCHRSWLDISHIGRSRSVMIVAGLLLIECD
jgi:hypothetical protein